MKILWFVQANFNPSNEKGGYNGAGWISSLRDELIKCNGIELGIAFFSNRDSVMVDGNVTYFTMHTPTQSLFHKIKSNLFIKKSHLKDEIETWPLYRDVLKSVVKEFSPDIIQIFGSENKYGLIGGSVNVPVVLHLQGLVNPYLNAYLPPFVSWKSYINYGTNSNRRLRIKQKYNWERYCLCEREIFKNIKFYLGRTVWDESVVKLFNPKLEYFYCSEILRNPFYEGGTRSLPNKLVITSTISSPLYKGLDLILKTAKLLVEFTDINFEWNVYGNIDAAVIEKLNGINHGDVYVNYKGTASANQIKDSLLNSTVYFHPSYIDNSPNSVCEAQILGCTVICTNVGGTSSLIKEGETGYLIPANDPYRAAYLLKRLYLNPQKNISVGSNAKDLALRRHNKSLIVSNLIEVYNKVIRENK